MTAGTVTPGTCVELVRERVSADNYTDLLLHVTAERDSDGVTDVLLAVAPVDIEEDSYDPDAVPVLSLDGIRKLHHLLGDIIATAEAYEAQANTYNENGD